MYSIFKNARRILEWMTESADNYQKYFSGKHLEIQPRSKGRLIYERFHLKELCFSDYINAVTHVSLTEIPTYTIPADNQYCIKSCQDS